VSAQVYQHPNIGGYAFVDDAGDVGTRGTSKLHFALGGYFVNPQDESGVLAALQGARQEFGLPANKVLHFVSLSHERRVKLAQILAGAPLVAFAAVLCKKAGPHKRPWQPEKLYNWMIRLVLERASWHFRDVGCIGSVTFAHLKGHQIPNTHAYVRVLQGLQTNIEWGHLHLPVRFGAPQTDERLQAADTISSAAGQAFQPGNLGICESRYLKELGPVLWRRQGNLLGYGVKLQPPLGAHPPCPTDHSWLSRDPP
jgi:hypothetical protein